MVFFFFFLSLLCIHLTSVYFFPEIDCLLLISVFCFTILLNFYSLERKELYSKISSPFITLYMHFLCGCLLSLRT